MQLAAQVRSKWFAVGLGRREPHTSLFLSVTITGMRGLSKSATVVVLVHVYESVLRTPTKDFESFPLQCGGTDDSDIAVTYCEHDRWHERTALV